MKKTIVVVLMVMSFNLFGLDHGLISGFEVGWNIYELESIKTATSDTRIIKDLNNSISIQIKTGYRIGEFRLIGTYENTLMYQDIDSFLPVQDRYQIELNYTFKNIEIGFYHWCDHPVFANKNERKFLLDSSKRKIYIRYYKEF